MDLQLVLRIFFGIFGLLIGSFLNVVIYRLPRKMSIVTPRSKCPSCGHVVSWYENIPVISYIFLKGKCSECGIKISKQYPLVEMSMGIAAFLLAPADLSFPSISLFIFNFSIISVFLAHILIDLEHHLLLDKLNIYLLLIILPYAIMNYDLFYWLVGGLIGFLGPYLVSEVYFKLRGIDGLGGGDIKLYGILGIILGPLGIVQNIFLSCAFGAIVGLSLIILKKMQRTTHYAFGPFIIVIAFLQIYFPKIVEFINPLNLTMHYN